MAILAGSSLVCETCAIAKARQKNVMKTRQGAEARRVHQRVFIDLFRAPKVKHLLDQVGTLRNPNCFYHRKSEIGKQLDLLWMKDDMEGRRIEIVRLDNAGENRSMIDIVNGNDFKLSITPEFISRATPQYNSKAEKGFETL